MGGEKDGSEGALYEQACLVHCDNTGGGKRPPPTVPPVQHGGAMEFLE